MKFKFGDSVRLTNFGKLKHEFLGNSIGSISDCKQMYYPNDDRNPIINYKVNFHCNRARNAIWIAEEDLEKAG